MRGVGKVESRHSAERFGESFKLNIKLKTSVWTLRLSIGLAALYLAFHGSLGAQTYSFSTYVSGGLNAPEGVAVDTQSNLYVADAINCVIRKVTPAGVVSILAGNGGIGSADGRGAAASFYYPQGVAVDAAGTVFVADTYNHTIRVITPAGQVSTLAGYPTVPGGVDGTGEYEGRPSITPLASRSTVEAITSTWRTRKTARSGRSAGSEW